MIIMMMLGSLSTISRSVDDNLNGGVDLNDT